MLPCKQFLCRLGGQTHGRVIQLCEGPHPSTCNNQGACRHRHIGENGDDNVGRGGSGGCESGMLATHYAVSATTITYVHLESLATQPHQPMPIPCIVYSKKTKTGSPGIMGSSPCNCKNWKPSSRLRCDHEEQSRLRNIPRPLV